MRAADAFFLPVFALLALVPFSFGDFTAYQLSLFILYGIVGQGIALCWGRVGILPLGQAMFFGLGAYLGGGALIWAEGNWALLLPCLVLAILLPALLAGLVALVVFRRQTGSGPFFSLITLALSMLTYQIALTASDLTGGFNGLTGIPPLPGTDPWGNLYWVILGTLLVTTLGTTWVLRAPIGTLWSAVAQNEARLSFLGYNVAGLKALAFAGSAALAALAGALYASQQGIVSPQTLGYVLSGELLIWTAVGGRQTVLGPVVGAVLIGFLSSELRDGFALWEVLLAAIFIGVVLLMPQGLGGLARPLLDKLSRKRKAPARDVIIPLSDAPSQPDLSFSDVEVTMGSVHILRGLSFDMKDPGLHCVIGPNGAGKTSSFNALSGLLPVSRGAIHWNGRDVTGRLPHQVARLGIARKLQVPMIFHDLSVADHLNIAIWAQNLSARDALRPSSFRRRNPVMDELFTLFPFLRDEQKTAGELSLGHRQMLEFAMSIMNKPTLVLLDEPCAGLSKLETTDMTGAIARMREKFGISALIVEHDFSVVETLSDHIYVLHQGELLAEGTLDQIRANTEVQAVYAGGSK